MSDDDPRRLALARAIDDDPDDLDAYRVYADLLGEQGDPRAQLTAMHQLRERLTDKPKLLHLEQRVEEYFERHRAQFLGPLDRYVATPSMSRNRRNNLRQHFTWANGFIRTATLQGELAARKEPLDRILGHLLGHSSGRFVVELVIRWPEESQALIDQLARRAPATLRSLELLAGDCDLTGLWAAVPRLHTLSITSEPTLGPIDLPALRVARFTGVHSARDLAAIGAARWPHLEVLGVRCAGDDLQPDSFAPLCERDDLAELRRLALRDVPFLDELLQRYAGSPLARGVSELDLGQGSQLTDEGVRAFVARGPVPLDVLEIPAHHVSPESVAMLGSVARKVLVKQYGD